ncbi:ABC transporter substrate-binding protein [Amycolatopsis cihanbeyliensis]|uniref:ABC-type branched-subunit amino acid transport system substrate-binding protein n=1 Tax=Amycolatopsis cihanbeyliensis TaxID=1128664 RepID=A0A542DS56_AMYCI|nr:ABC transporter substrate-binding protein [Amycolatopsis cihanbeyliensis]TQJ05888.1 ABC-type branched-subunit amino acid transport system substrate-binding protein [Amycolatopsis cihanbeyliensis]
MTARGDRIRPPRPTWSKWMVAGGGVLLLAVALVAVFVVVPEIDEAGRRCGAGVEKRGEHAECIGVTDGGYVFSPELTGVQEDIRAENESVAGSGKPYVTIAVMLPMTLAENDILSAEWVRHQLQGAYIAQHRANTTRSWGSLPLIRLVLANPGSRLNHWEPVVDDLVGRVRDERLVAVTGIGLSLDTSRDAMERLSRNQIPVIASHLAADEFSEIPGFMRVSPTSSTYGTAAAEYVRSTAHTATIVQDINPDDLYPETLVEAFTGTFEDDTHHIVGRTEVYDSSLPGIENTFLQMMPNICGNEAEVVYFAGRENHLTAFVAELAQRPCLDRPITVLTGDLALIRPPSPEMRRGLEANVTVLGPGLAHPDAWATEPQAFNPAAIASFQEPHCTDCFRAVFPEERLDDGIAILAHDAVLTVVWAIRGIPRTAPAEVTAKDVLQAKNRLHGELAVPGASGMISFDDRGDPVRKAVPILRVRLDDTPEYVQLSTPTG